jgi:ADP-ribose pyrophosphatase YjhB (NUDIX family)
MKTILTIRDSDFGLDFPDPPVYKERRSSRAIVFDRDGKIAFLHVTKKHFYKLPGGGVEEGESIEEALHRELSEEIGCSVKNIREFGSIEEFRNKFSLHQISYCFLADLAGEKGVPHLEQDEIADGFKPVWINLGDAIKIFESNTDVEDYEGKFVQMRDLAFLKQTSQR